MTDLIANVQEYCSILVQEQALSERKQELRLAIASEMNGESVSSTSGVAQMSVRTKLIPNNDRIARTLNVMDILEFANFSATRVDQVLRPNYGDVVDELFKVVKEPFLLIHRTKATDATRGVWGR